jgi:hypothetical protein
MKAVVIACLLLAGCGSTQVQKTTLEVPVPVKVPCVNTKPERPVYETPKINIDKTTDGELLLATARDWVRSRAYEKKLEAIVEGCSTLGRPAAPGR